MGPGRRPPPPAGEPGPGRALVAALLTLAGLLVLALAPPAASRSAESLAAIAAIEGVPPAGTPGLTPLPLVEVLKKHRVPGVSVAVIWNFDLAWARGYGVAEQESGRPVTPETLFQAASISKPVTALAFLTQVQAGKATLDQDINDLLRSWKVPVGDHARGRPVTARTLLSHTSGADDGFGFPGYLPGAPRPTLVQILNGQPPSSGGPVLFTRPPLTAFKYSGGGTTIIQLALMDLLGQPFADLMRDRVLLPLGMTASTFEQPLPAAREAQAARAHGPAGETREAPWHVYPEQAAAGLWTTPGDLARFGLEVQRGIRGSGARLLTSVLAREMATPVGVGPFAVGLEVIRRGPGWYLSHSGDNWGFKAHLLVHLARGYGVVVMANGEGGWPVVQEIENRVARAYGWDWEPPGSP